MNEWKRLIQEGNQSFNSGLFYSAERYYKIACNFACEICPNESHCSNHVAALVVSYQNLAEVYFKQGQYGMGIQQYQELHQKLLQLSMQNQQKTELLDTIKQAIYKMGTELLHIIKTQGIQSQQSRQVIANISKAPVLSLH